MKNSQNKISALLVGEAASGKTSLIVRYIEGKFMQSTLTTLGIDFRIKKVDYKGTEYKMEIWDTAGQEKYHAIPPTLFNKSDAVAIVFSLIDKESYDKTEMWVNSILKNKNKENISLVIMCNKKDLTQERVVTAEMIQNLEKKYGIKCFESSALTGDGVADAFNYLIEVTVARRQNCLSPRDSFFVKDENKFKKKNKCC